jgi:GAF domain-containing protein
VPRGDEIKKRLDDLFGELQAPQPDEHLAEGAHSPLPVEAQPTRSPGNAVTADQLNRLAAVAEFSANVTSLQDPCELLQCLVDLAYARFDLHLACVYTLDGEGKAWRITAEAGQAPGNSGLVIRRDDEYLPVARAGRGRQAVRITPLPNSRGLADFAQVWMGAAIPMIAGEQTLGVLEARCDRRAGISETDLHLLTALAFQAAGALHAALRRKESAEQAHREQALRHLSTQAQTGVDIETIVHAALREIGQALDRRVYIRLDGQTHATGATQDGQA